MIALLDGVMLHRTVLRELDFQNKDKNLQLTMNIKLKILQG